MSVLVKIQRVRRIGETVDYPEQDLFLPVVPSVGQLIRFGMSDVVRVQSVLLEPVGPGSPHGKVVVTCQ